MKKIIAAALLLLALGAHAENQALDCFNAAWSGMSCQGYRDFTHPRSSGNIEPPPDDSAVEVQCRSEADLAYKVAQASAKGIPIDTVRSTMSKVLANNHVSTSDFNRNIQMVNRAYAWQKHGYTPERIRDADFQACRGTPVLEVPITGQ